MPNYDIDDAIRALSTSAEDIQTDVRVLGEQWGEMKRRILDLEGHEFAREEITLVVWALRVAHAEWAGVSGAEGKLADKARELADLTMVNYNLIPEDVPWITA